MGVNIIRKDTDETGTGVIHNLLAPHRATGYVLIFMHAVTRCVLGGATLLLTSQSALFSKDRQPPPIATPSQKEAKVSTEPQPLSPV